MQKKIALILSGCGLRDGSEITEAVSLLIALHQHGAVVTCFAPDMSFDVINHHTGMPTGEKRNVMIEAARISRGHIQDLKDLNANDFEGLAFASGMDAKANVPSILVSLIKEFHKQSKPIGAVGISSVILAKVLGPEHVELTMGNDAVLVSEIQKTGAHHVDCPVDDYVTDRLTKVITSPAYMYAAKPSEVFKGISGLAKELVEMS